MKMNVEFEMNRAWIVDEADEIIGETNYIVSDEWLRELFDKEYKDRYDSLDDFVEVYDPETEGEYIYRKAIKDGALVEDLGVVMC